MLTSVFGKSGKPAVDFMRARHAPIADVPMADIIEAMGRIDGIVALSQMLDFGEEILVWMDDPRLNPEKALVKALADMGSNLGVPEARRAVCLATWAQQGNLALHCGDDGGFVGPPTLYEAERLCGIRDADGILIEGWGA